MTFRFTIRDLLWLMVVVGMGVGWWLKYRKFTPREKAAVETLRTMMKDYVPSPVKPV